MMHKGGAVLAIVAAHTAAIVALVMFCSASRRWRCSLSDSSSGWRFGLGSRMRLSGIWRTCKR